MILLLAARDGDDDAATARRDPAQLAERRELTALALRARPVDPVVPSDVLERRDAEDEVEARVRERQLTDVGDDRVHLRDLGLDQVDAHELGDSRCDERGEVCGLRVRGPDVQDSPRAP